MNFSKSVYAYIIILVLFIIWMFFLDTHSWLIHNELNKEINKLELQKEALEKIIEEDKKEIKLLNNNDSLEKFAREKYRHKKENETIFIIENNDSVR
tara:strand:+ start:4378 stop:4668 length:291 start_codon:yes stop_codon:yes gene_type:complete